MVFSRQSTTNNTSKLDDVLAAIDKCKTLKISDRLARGVFTFTCWLEEYAVAWVMASDHMTPSVKDDMKKVKDVAKMRLELEGVKAYVLGWYQQHQASTL